MKRVYALLATGGLTLALLSCSDDPTGLLSPDALPAPSAQSLAPDDAVFGPVVVERGVGNPQVHVVEVTGVTGYWRLVVENGAGEVRRRVASATVRVDGVELLGPDAFDAGGGESHPDLYTFPLRFEDPTTVEVELAGSPGGRMAVWVEGYSFGPDGGSLPLAGGGSIVVPEGALEEDVTLTIADAAPLPAGTEPVSGLSFLDFGPEGQTFTAPVELRIPYDEDALPQGVEEEDLRLYTVEDGAVVPVPGSRVDDDADLVIGETTHFSPFGPLPATVTFCPGGVGFETWDEAKEAVAPGGTVEICGGVHAVERMVVDKPVTVAGGEPLADTAVIVTTDWYGFAVTGIDSGTVTFRDFRIENGAREGIFVTGVYDQVVVEDMVVRTTGGSALGGVQVNGSSAVAGAHVTVARSIFQGGFVSVFANGEASVDVVESESRGTSFVGIQYQTGSTGRVEGTLFEACGANGCLRALGRKPFRAIGNTLRGQTSAPVGHGIQIFTDESGDSEIRDNLIEGLGAVADREDPTAYAFQSGLFIGGDGSVSGSAATVVTGNTVRNAGRGLLAQSDSVVGQDNVFETTWIGLYSSGSVWDFSRNDVTDWITPLVVFSAPEPRPADLACNWWGAEGEPEASADPAISSSIYLPTATGPIAGTELECDPTPLPPPTVVITAPDSGTVVSPGDPLTFSGTADDPADGDLSDAISWSSDLDGALGTGASIAATLSAGRHLVKASVTSAGGLEGADSTVVVVGDPPSVVIQSPGDQSVLPSGWDDLFARASATDAQEGTLFNVEWTSDRDGFLGTGPGVGLDLSVGTHELVATATDATGLSGGDTIHVTVVGPSVIPLNGSETLFAFDLTGFPDGPPYRSIEWRATFDAGDPVSGSDDLVTVVYGDTEGTDPVQVRNDTQLIGQTGGTEYGPLTTANPIFEPLLDGTFAFGLRLSTGTANLTSFTACGVGDSGLRTACKTLTGDAVSSPPSVEITSSPTSPVASGDPTTFTASASDPEDGDLSSSVDWSSSRDGFLGSGSSITVTLSDGLHDITASVTDSDLLASTATTSLTVLASGPLPAEMAYVADPENDRIQILDLTTNSILGAIPVGDQPSAVAFTPDGATALVANQGSRDVSFIDVASSTVVSTLDLVWRTPLDLAVSPDGGTLYVTAGGGGLLVIDLATEAVTNTLPVGSNPLSIGLSADGSTALVANHGSVDATLVELASGTVTTIPMPSNPNAAAIAADKGYVVTASDGVQVVDLASGTVTASIPVLGWRGIGVAPDGSSTYVGANGGGEVFEISTATDVLTRTFSLSGGTVWDVSVSSDGGRLLTANYNSRDVSVVDLGSGTETATVFIGAPAVGVAVRPTP